MGAGMGAGMGKKSIFQKTVFCKNIFCNNIFFKKCIFSFFHAFLYKYCSLFFQNVGAADPFFFVCFSCKIGVPLGKKQKRQQKKKGV